MTKSLKGIKSQIVKQIKKQHPYFSRLTKKQKKQVIEDVWNEIQNSPAVESANVSKPHELLGIPEIPGNILNINKMRELIQHSGYKTIPMFSRKKDITNPELKLIHKLVDWNLVNHLLAHRSYTPGKCLILPAQYFKAELLKHLRYPELSYRKFCKQEINNAERPNNLIKHRDGLEPLRPKGQHNSTVAATIANITTLLIEIVGFRKKKKLEKARAEQLQIFRRSA